MPLADICVHSATIETRAAGGTWIEGEYDETALVGVTFPCVFFPPGTTAPGVRQRVIQEPTLMHAGEDVNGTPFLLPGEGELELTVPGLPASWGGRWQLAGPAQPLGRPGDDPIGEYVTLRRVSGGES